MNDVKEVEVASHQVMRCILCYNVVNNINARTNERKGLITYYGIIAFKTHVDGDHSILVKKIEGEINNEILGIIEKQLIT